MSGMSLPEKCIFVKGCLWPRLLNPWPWKHHQCHVLGNEFHSSMLMHCALQGQMRKCLSKCFSDHNVALLWCWPPWASELTSSSVHLCSPLHWHSKFGEIPTGGWFIRYHVHKFIVCTHRHTDSPKTQCLRRLIASKGIKMPKSIMHKDRKWQISQNCMVH